MATMHLTNATVSINGVDLASYVSDVELPIETETSDSGWATDRLTAALGDFSATFTGRWDGPPLFPDVERTISVYVPWSVARRWLAALERRRRARLRRMHTAYRRKRRGRW